MGCGCSRPAMLRYLCWDCWSRVQLIAPPFCTLCGDPVAGDIDHDFRCYCCNESRPHFERARSLARYDGVMRDMICEFKYNNALWLAADLAELLQSSLEAEYEGLEFDIITCVPLHLAKRRARGYNQSAILARALSKRIEGFFWPRALLRNRPTSTQTNLTATERISNIRGAFEARSQRWLEGKKVLLIDDVMTTGATVNECASVLKEAGCSGVYVATLARG